MARKLTPAQERIENAFLSIRKTRRIDEIIVLELCKKAEVSHATFYKYYEDIYYLNYAIERRDFLGAFNRLMLDSTSDAHQNYIKALVSFYTKHRPLYRTDEIHILMGNIRENLTETLNLVYPHGLFAESTKSNDILNLLAFNLSHFPMLIIFTNMREEVPEFTDEAIEVIAKLWETNIRAVFKELCPELTEEELENFRKEKKAIFAEVLKEPSLFPPQYKSRSPFQLPPF